jgi:DNA-binding IclR family transcriptional regulator
MSVKALPDEVVRFLNRHIDSVEQLEVLLLLHRAAESAWTAEMVAAALYTQPASAARRLETLAADGLIERASQPGAYRYLPSGPGMGEMISTLADTYRERRVAVVTAIASKPMENVRAFSDAFRLRRKES